MSEDITTTTSTAVSAYSGMAHDELIDGIKKESSKARTRGQQMIESMRRIGEMLIEMKRRVPHGDFISSASWQTNLPERTIQRYMQMAKGVAPHRTVKDRERGHRKENLEVLRLTEFLPDDGEAKPDTMSVLPAVEPPAPRPPSRPADIVVDAEIVVHAPKVETPDEMFQRGLDSLQKSMPPAEYQAMLERALEGPQAPATAPPQIPLETTVETEVDIEPQDPPAPAVAAPTASPAPSMIETSEDTLAEILALLPRLRPAEVTELHRVIESRWMKPQAQAARP